MCALTMFLPCPCRVVRTAHIQVFGRPRLHSHDVAVTSSLSSIGKTSLEMEHELLQGSQVRLREVMVLWCVSAVAA
jgi:hypothetical protein